MNKFLVAWGLFVASIAINAQSIRPGTAYCVKYSDAHMQSYCIDATPCKTTPDGSYMCLKGTTNPPAGATISDSSCWSMATDYTCLQYVSDCLTYTSDSNCTEMGSKTCTQNSSGSPMISNIAKLGSCLSSTRTFSCKDPSKPDSASTTLTTTCDTTITQNGLDWTTTTASAAGDFVQAATAQEFARQIVVYGTKDSNGISGMFPGHSSACADGDFGLKNCCKSSGGGAVSNHGVAGLVTTQTALAAISYGAQTAYAGVVGSTLVSDTLISNAPEFMGPGLDSMFNHAGNLQSGMGAFGFGTTQASAGGLMFGETGSVPFTAGGGEMYFNPYALAAAVAIQVVMDAMSCTQDEIDLAMAKGKNFCHYVGSYCSKEIKVLGKVVGCLETSQTYCCYNGLLAKAIEEGAHQQLGISWGSPQSPACGGLSVAQLQALDFSTTAMAAFMAPFQQEIMAGFNNSVSPSLTNGAVTSAAQTSATTRSKALCLQSQKQNPGVVCN